MLVEGRKVTWLLCVFALFAGLPALAEEPSAVRRSLTYEEAFGTSMRPPWEAPQEDGLLGSLPTVTGWLDDVHYLETRRDDEGRGQKVYTVNAGDGAAEVYRDYTALGKDLPRGFSLRRAATQTDDLTAYVFSRDDDLYLLDVASGKLRRLTANPGEESNPTFSPDGKWIAYTRGNNLFALDLEAGLERQLTADGSDSILNGYASWVYYEEILGRRGRYRAFWWSPDSTRLAFLRFDDSPVPQFPIYRADGQHGELELQRYPKAGDPNPYVQLGVVSVSDGTLAWMDFEPKADHYVAFPVWSPDSKTVVAQWMNRGQDTIRLYACDPATGAKKQIHEERQPSWVEFYEDLRFLEGDDSFLLLSEVDGWRHIYLHGPDGKLTKQLTSGKWRVDGIEEVDEDGGWVYFTGRPGKSWDTQVMRVKLDGSKLEALTQEAGSHRAQVSPDGSYFIDTVSTVDQPSRMTLRRADGTVVRELGDQRTPAMDEIAWGAVELFTIPSGDGYDLPAVWVLPADMDKTKKYPVIVSIYGGPASASVANRWRGLQPHYWAQRGVITFVVDHRGSGHFGKAAVALMHRNLGKWEMADYSTAAKWLRAQPFVDGDGIGITGGSYGGYATMMAMTAAAPHFNFGAAGSSVSDWQLYDSVYTERYMDTPAENPEGYKNGAVLTWVERYKGGLRITHGTMDDNVHMQNSVQVVDWLVSNNKPFELMLYPNSRHGYQASQRPHSTREGHDFWARTLLDGNIPLAPFLEPPRMPSRPDAE